MLQTPAWAVAVHAPIASMLVLIPPMLARKAWENKSPSIPLFAQFNPSYKPCQVYTESTDGSNVEAKESALVWHYRDADPDFGHWQVPPLAPACLRVCMHDQGRLHRSLLGLCLHRTFLGLCAWACLAG